MDRKGNFENVIGRSHDLCVKQYFVPETKYLILKNLNEARCGFSLWQADSISLGLWGASTSQQKSVAAHLIAAGRQRDRKGPETTPSLQRLPLPSPPLLLSGNAIVD